MAKSTDSSSDSAGLAMLGWGALALGVLVVVLYGLSVATPWSLNDPLGLQAGSSPDPARYQQALDDALDEAWDLLGGHGGGVHLADLTTDVDRLRRAGQLIDGVLASRPGDARAYVLQGLMHMASGNREAARTFLERSLEAGGGHQSLLVLGTLHFEAGEFEDSEAVFRRAVEEYPQSASAWNNLGRVQERLGKQDEADAAFRRYEELAGKI